MTLSASTQTGAVLAFPRADLRALLSGALKHHRLPENLAAALVRRAAMFPDLHPDAALAFALDRMMSQAPIDFEQARAILLVGPSGAGKSAVAAKICAASTRETILLGAREGLARLRAKTLPPDALAVIEAEGFHPLNPRARAAFAALNEIAGVDVIGVVSALADAEDVGELVAAFGFKRIIVTGLDRTRRLGAVVAAITGGARLAHVMYGPDGGLEGLEPGALAAALLAPPTH